jgi:hypothetical protein
MRPDPVMLASGAVSAALGVLVLLDSSGAIAFTPGWTAVALLAGCGLILLAAGIAASGRSRHD